MEIEDYNEQKSERVVQSNVQLIKGDCLKLMKDVPNESIDLVLIDPPYFQIMKTDWKGDKYDWDNQWETLEEYQNWIFNIGVEIKRILKSTGSFYIFADDKVCAYVQIILDKLFNLENSITWVKPNNLTIKGWTQYKSYSPITEKILFYSKEFNQTGTHIINNSISFKPSREYLMDKMKKKGMCYADVDRILHSKGLQTKKSSHAKLFMNPEQKQGRFIGKNQYYAIKEELDIDRSYEDLRSEFEGLRKDNERLRLELESERRHFNPESNFTDVWTFNIMGGKESVNHPTQKPLKIIERIVKTSSKEGCVVLDCFMGSGTTGVACKSLNRDFIGMESDEEYFKLATKRINDALRGVDENE